VSTSAGLPFRATIPRGIDAFGGKAKEEQTSLLRMQRFLVDHAGEVLKNIALGFAFSAGRNKDRLYQKIVAGMR